MASQYSAMTTALETESDDMDVAGIPFPAAHCASKLEFPAMMDSDSSLGEVLAFIRTVADQPVRGVPAGRL